MHGHSVGAGGGRRWLTYAASAVALATAFGACGDNSKSPTAPTSPAFAVGGSLGVNLDQCANAPRTANCSWQNGDLNGNNSTYAEGLVVPFRLEIDGLAPGSTHSFHLNYDFTAGGHEGYDFLADFDATEMVDICAVGGGGRSALCDQSGGIGTGSQFDFPSDTFHVSGTLGSLTVAGAQSASLFNVNNKRHLKIWGGTITNITTPVHSGPTGGNSSTDMVVTFTVTGSNVAFAWGAHLAQSSYWKNSDGTADGAGQISGAPWHMRTQQLDNAGNKNQDRSIQPSAIIHPPTVTLTKTADSATVNAGSQIGFTITAANSGSGDATSFALSDPLPTGVGISWSIASQSGSPTCVISSGTLLCPSTGTGTLAAGATLTIHITSSTTSGSCGTYQNTATVSFSTATGGTVPPPAVASVTVNCASIGVVKTADASPVSAGDSIGFTITATNSATATGTATGVTIKDTLPTTSGLNWTIKPTNSACSIASGVLTCNFGSLAPGGSASVHIVSPTTSASCATIPNTAHVSTGNDGSAQSTAQVVVNCPSLSVTKTADKDTVDAGSNIGFTIQVSNAGPGTAKAVTLADTLPTGTGVSWSISPAVTGCSITTNTLSCNFGDLAASASASVHVTSPTTSASCKKYVNTASASGSNNAVVTGKDSVLVQCPSLSITKTPATQTKDAGQSFSWTVTLTNSGPGTALAASISDPLPSVTGVSYTLGTNSPASANCAITSGTLNCGPISLAAGSSISAVINATTTANRGCVSGGFKNIATGSATGVSDVKDTAAVTLQCPNLTISKTPDKVGDTGYSVSPGDSARFTITVSNTGAGAATNVVVTDTLPSGLTWVDNKSECSITSQILTCSLTSLAGSGSFSVTVAALIPAGFVLNPPTTGTTALEIDGNLVPNGGLDWSNDSINCTSTPKVGCDLDKPTGTGDDSFGQGTKEDTPVPSVVSGSIPNNKSDLTRFYVTSNRVGTHDLLYLAWERVQAPSGTTNMDFELNQSKDTSSNGVTPVRTAGDILIKYDLAKGGTVPTISFNKWITATSAGSSTPAALCEASNSFPCWGKTTTASTGVLAAINADTATDPLAPSAPRVLDALTFGEASIDLQASGIFQSGVCVSFGQAYLKSRSSSSFTAEIKDFIAPTPISVTSCSDKTLNNTAWVQADSVSAISDGGQIKVTVSSAFLLDVQAVGRLAWLDAGSAEATTSIVAAMPASAESNRPRVAGAGIDRSSVIPERARRGERRVGPPSLRTMNVVRGRVVSS